MASAIARDGVVYLIFPTSNRNIWQALSFNIPLYILSFLHQTATWYCNGYALFCCISYLSYIKPQLIPRNLTIGDCCISYLSYIKPQLD